MATDKKRAEKGDIRKWCKQGLATDLMREGVVPGFSPKAENFVRGSCKHFTVGHDEFEMSVGELGGGV